MDIKSVIKKYGYTVNSLAKKHNVGQSRLNQMVNGNPSGKNLEWLASLIGCHPAEFFADWQQPAPQPAAESASAEQQQAASEQQAGGQQPEQEELPFGQQQPSQEQQPQGTTLVGLVRCPQCGRAIRLFAEE